MKDTIETDVWDNSIEDNFSSNWTLDDAVEADRKNLQINKADVEQLIKTSEEIRKTADQLIGIGQHERTIPRPGGIGSRYILLFL